MLIRAKDTVCFGDSEEASAFWTDDMKTYARQHLRGLGQLCEDGLKFQTRVRGRKNIVALAKCCLLSQSDLLYQQKNDPQHGSDKQRENGIQFLDILVFERSISLPTFDVSKDDGITVNEWGLLGDESEVLRKALETCTNGIITCGDSLCAYSVHVFSSNFLFVL